MARRRNAIAHRFARMRGLPPEEKALMQRIGNLMDSALNNRQASNPFEQSQTRTNRQVYPPTGLLTQTGISSVKVLWDATPSNQLLRYEIDFINLTTGLSETKTSFTNEIIYKGANGSYIAKVKSVGRDGSSSTIRDITFALGDDIMLLEGAKNRATELGTLVQDNMELRDGYSIYVWGSCVLDKYMLQTNNNIVFKLWRADRPDASFGEAYLVETVTLYPGTVSGTNIDDTARAGLITRPEGVRSGSFETSQSVMFSPQQVDQADDGKNVTFFLQAVNREVEQDEVCLSLVIWSGADGIGAAVPGDPHVPDAPRIWPHFNSFHKQGAPNGQWQYNYPYDTRSWHATIENGFSLVGNHWTIAMWVRFDTLNGYEMATKGDDEDYPQGGNQQILNRGTIDTTGGGDDYPNKIKILATGSGDPGCPGAGNGWNGKHNLIIDLFNYRIGTTAAGGIEPDGAGGVIREWKASGCCYGDRSEKSGIFPWGDSQTGDPDTNDAWYFIVLCFEGGNFVNANLPKLRVYINNGLDEEAIDPHIFMQLLIPGLDGTINGIEQNDAGAIQWLFEAVEDHINYHYYGGVYTGDLYMGPRVTAGTQYYQIGVWNTALDLHGTDMGQINALFNGGNGSAIDWTRNAYFGPPTGDFDDYNITYYGAAHNLVHLLQAGAVEEPFATKQAGRDTGYHLPDWEGEMNWTFNVIDEGHEFHYRYHDNPEPPYTTPPDRYHQRKLLDSVWYDGLGNSWTRGCDIYDILSPLGTNGTTQYDYAYPGIPGQSFWQDGDDTYPDFDSWVAAGADLTILPWLSGPYPPGYHKDDPDRPIQ